MRRVYKSGRIRLTGSDLFELRRQCWERAQGRSEHSGVALYWEPRFPGDPLAFDMAHKTSRGAGGSDTLDNVRALSHEEHMWEHQGKL